MTQVIKEALSHRQEGEHMRSSVERIAAFAAAEAVVHLLHRADAERRSLFLVERT